MPFPVDFSLDFWYLQDPKIWELAPLGANTTREGGEEPHGLDRASGSPKNTVGKLLTPTIPRGKKQMEHPWHLMFALMGIPCYFSKHFSM